MMNSALNLLISMQTIFHIIVPDEPAILQHVVALNNELRSGHSALEIMNYTLKVMNCACKMMNSVVKMMNSVLK